MPTADDDLNQQNIDRFNAIAAEWDSQPRHVETAAAVAEAMRVALAPIGEESLLEFGCGTGLITAALAPHVARILALDSAPGMIDALREKLRRHGIDNVDAKVGDLPDNPPEGRFDAIVSSMTMHHIADTDALLRVLFDRLKSGGRIALADLDREDGSFHGDKPGIAHHGFDRNVLADKLKAAGFADVEFTIAHHMERTLDDGTTRRFPIFLAVATRPG
ncbi:class I SAM-dependent methyltransferase [Salinisphaera hydrothermalis]|uniref:class I SAM-dependent methyltransferase n=1 Tax=Salinisphaera hydrothermalis TaxID=563188 RepID=UPI0033407C43